MYVLRTPYKTDRAMTDQTKDKKNASFHGAMDGVQRIKQDRVTPFRKRRRPIAEQSQRDDEAVMQSLLSDHDDAEIETGDELLFVRSGLQTNVVRKLRRGQYALEAELDLHSHRVTEAHELINDFLRRTRKEGKRCVRIIHGKGLGSVSKLPILKGKVSAWLRKKDEVLAFCSARPNDGGTGAVYVLLKRK